jgi:TolB-like protein
MKRKSVLVFCFGVFIMSSCASAPKSDLPAPKSDLPVQKGNLPAQKRDLTVNDIKTAITLQQQAIVDSISEHAGGGGKRPGVAVLDIASDDSEIGIFAAEEIILQLVRTRKFRVVDRDSIETILKEHKFQYSGVVNDQTAVSIGRFIGASVIITGVIRQRNSRIDFSLKILDVETAEIIDLISIPILE